MPRNIIGDPPFPPVLLLNENRDFVAEDLERIVGDRPQGVSICIRYPEGPAKRGGYFFHFSPVENRPDQYQSHDFERRVVHVFSAEDLVRFINHCTGRSFDERSFVLCQTELNFLKDAEPNI